MKDFREIIKECLNCATNKTQTPLQKTLVHPVFGIQTYCTKIIPRRNNHSKKDRFCTYASSTMIRLESEGIKYLCNKRKIE